MAGTTATASSEPQKAELAATVRAAANLETQRLREFADQGMTSDEAAAALAEEQRQAAADIRKRIFELTAEGLSYEEIAAVTHGLVLVSGPDGSGGPAPQSDQNDMWLDSASISFAMQCNCYSVISGWERQSYLENGRDVVGIRLTKSVTNNMGGSGYYCRTSSSCTFVSTGNMHYEEPAGVAHTFNTNGSSGGSHHGQIGFSYQGNLGGVQPYTHYGHAWTTVSITGVGISTTGFSVTWEYNDNAWYRQGAGRYCGSC